MINFAEIRALLVSPDSAMASLFSEVFDEIGVATCSCANEGQAAEALSDSKFEALVLDFDNLSPAVPFIRSVRESSSSRDAIVFAVATEMAARQRAFADGANFAFERPFLVPQIKQALQTAYSLMLRDRRRYFRCPIECPIKLTRKDGFDVEGTTINISGRGAAVKIPAPLEAGELLSLSFKVPEADLSVDAFGSVVWDDKHGKAGITFECTSFDVGHRLAAWLDAQFYRQLRSATGSPPTRPV